jgi:TonB family protein
MLRASLSLIFTFFACRCLGAQAPSDLDNLFRVGPGVTTPRLLHKIEPEYSPEARADHIQGKVVLQIVINEAGRPIDINVISPLGFGLDERAQSAVEKWQFAPGMKGELPVKILATVEVSFTFPEIWYDAKAERQRTEFNVALHGLKGSDAKAMERAVKSIQDLARQRFPAAMYVLGSWEIAGDHVSQNPADGLALIRQAADRYYGPALYEIGIRQVEGRDLDKEPAKGLETMRHASVLGSPQAQFALGARYEIGEGVPRELDRARRYFRLCAAQGVPLCQYRVGKLLLETTDRPESNLIQAVAWLELAAEHGVPEAKDLSSTEAAKLTPQQTAWVTTLKTQLVRK